MNIAVTPLTAKSARSMHHKVLVTGYHSYKRTYYAGTGTLRMRAPVRRSYRVRCVTLRVFIVYDAIPVI